VLDPAKANWGAMKADVKLNRDSVSYEYARRTAPGTANDEAMHVGADGKWPWLDVARLFCRLLHRLVMGRLANPG